MRAQRRQIALEPLVDAAQRHQLLARFGDGGRPLLDVVQQTLDERRRRELNARSCSARRRQARRDWRRLVGFGGAARGAKAADVAALPGSGSVVEVDGSSAAICVMGGVTLIAGGTHDPT